MKPLLSEFVKLPIDISHLHHKVNKGELYGENAGSEILCLKKS